MIARLGLGVDRELAVLAVAWTALAVIVQPTGDFPLNDDWTYARSVAILFQEGRLDLVYAAVPLVTQVVWGWLFSLPLGFSFTALRVSTWVLGLVGLFAMYALLRATVPTRRLALFGALLLAVNPFYLSLALTFMTDIPFVALALAALAALARGLEQAARPQLALGFVLLVLALLVRQPAIAIALGFAVACIVVRPLTWATLVLAAAPTAVCLVVLLAFDVIVRRTIGLPPLYGNPYDPVLAIASDAPTVIGLVLGRMTVILLYVGLLTLPITVVLAGPVYAGLSPRGRSVVVSVVAAAAAGGALSWVTGGVRPLGNVVYDIGIGPPLLRDVYLRGLRNVPTAPAVLWLAATIAAFLGTAILGVLAAVWARRIRAGERQDSASRPAAAIALVAAAVLASFLAVTGFLDRYLLPVVAFVTIGAVALARPPPPPSARWFATGSALLTALGLVSVGGTHDYFAWNRARWEAVDFIQHELGADPAQIDGGFEFYGWVRYRDGDPEDPVLGWARRMEEHVVAFGPIDGYSLVREFSYDRWLPPGTGGVVVLRKLGDE